VCEERCVVGAEYQAKLGDDSKSLILRISSVEKGVQFWREVLGVCVLWSEGHEKGNRCEEWFAMLRRGHSCIIVGLLKK